jgi:hypothetical protein
VIVGSEVERVSGSRRPVPVDRRRVVWTQVNWTPRGERPTFKPKWERLVKKIEDEEL